jgi:hypothetical protein
MLKWTESQAFWPKNIGRLMLISLCAWLLLLGVVGAGTTSPPLQVSPELHDFGAVKRMGGKVQTTFTLRNQGETALTIRRLWTSCPCTTATLVVAQRKSPEFHMLDSHPDWSETLNSGEEATLLVSFDPNYHGPGGVGLQQKLIRITSGGLQNPLAQLMLSATVVDDPK